VTGAPVDRAALRRPLDRASHQLVRGPEDRPRLVVRGLGDPAPWADASLPERLRLPHVADSGDDPLVEKRVADLSGWIAAQIRNHGLEVWGLGEDVRAEPADGVTVELEHRPVPEHGFALGASEDEPRTTEQP
jgi:hypothetical protein